MNEDIKFGSNWIHAYPVSGEARLKHRVVMVGPDEVVTWSDPATELGTGGYSWLGPIAQFRQEFRTAGPATWPSKQ